MMTNTPMASNAQTQTIIVGRGRSVASLGFSGFTKTFTARPTG